MALPNDVFELTITNFAHPYGQVQLARINLKGHIEWRGDHPIAAGAHKVDFTADTAYVVTPLLQSFADVLNKVATNGYETWVVGKPQSIFEKSFAPFGLAAGIN